MVEEAKNITDTREKKNFIKLIEEAFNKIMSQYPSLKELVEDALIRIMEDNNDEINETIIFANNIDEANEIANEINITY
jgi:type I site-specific restriction endonuclease